MAEFPVHCAQPAGKSFTANQWYHWKLDPLKVCHLVVPTHQITKNPKWGTHTRKIGFIHPVQRRKIRWIQHWNYFSDQSKYGRDFVRKLSTRANPGKQKHWNALIYPFIYSRSPRSRQTNKCVGSRVYRREKFRKFLTLAEPELAKTAVFCGILRTTYRKSFSADQRYLWKAARKMCVLGVLTHQESTMWTLNPRNIPGSINLFHIRVWKFAEFNSACDYFFSSKRYCLKTFGARPSRIDARRQFTALMLTICLSRLVHQTRKFQ